MGLAIAMGLLLVALALMLYLLYSITRGIARITYALFSMVRDVAHNFHP